MLGLLRHQLAVTISAVDGFGAWAAGDASAAKAVLDTEREGEAAKRELLSALRAAFVIPLEPEDVFALSRGVDRILPRAGDLVREAEAMDCPPDAGIAEIGRRLGAVPRTSATRSRTSARTGTRRPQPPMRRSRQSGSSRSAYYRGMAGLLEVEDLRERMLRRQLYRRCSRIGEPVVDVAERVIYAVVKQS